MQSATCVGVKSKCIPNACKTFEEPHFDDTARLPCFATATPQLAATTLAAVEIFIDPTNGGEFVYKLTDDNFTLYSKGENNIDEKGAKYDKKADGTRTDDILFWPQRSCEKFKKSKNSESRVRN